MKQKKFNSEFRETDRKVRAKLYKSGKHWVRVLLSNIGLLRVSGGMAPEKVTIDAKTVKEITETSEKNKQLILKGAAATAALLGGTAVVNQTVQADQTNLATTNQVNVANSQSETQATSESVSQDTTSESVSVSGSTSESLSFSTSSSESISESSSVSTSTSELTTKSETSKSEIDSQTSETEASKSETEATKESQASKTSTSQTSTSETEDVSEVTVSQASQEANSEVTPASKVESVTTQDNILDIATIPAEVLEQLPAEELAMLQNYLTTGAYSPFINFAAGTSDGYDATKSILATGVLKNLQTTSPQGIIQDVTWEYDSSTKELVYNIHLHNTTTNDSYQGIFFNQPTNFKINTVTINDSRITGTASTSGTLYTASISNMSDVTIKVIGTVLDENQPANLNGFRVGTSSKNITNIPVMLNVSKQIKNWDMTVATGANTIGVDTPSVSMSQVNSSVSESHSEASKLESSSKSTKESQSRSLSTSEVEATSRAASTSESTKESQSRSLSTSEVEATSRAASTSESTKESQSQSLSTSEVEATSRAASTSESLVASTSSSKSQATSLLDLQVEGPSKRYIWVDQDGEQIQHPFVIASYNKDVKVTEAFGTTAAKDGDIVDAEKASKLNNGLTYTPENGKVVVSGGFTANVFKTNTDVYTVNTVVTTDTGTKDITDNNKKTRIIGVNHRDNIELPVRSWTKPVTEAEIIDAIKGQVNAQSTAEDIQALTGTSTIINYELKPGQTLPTSGTRQPVKVIATLPSNGVDAQGNPLPGETKELTVYVSYDETTSVSASASKSTSESDLTSTSRSASASKSASLSRGTSTSVEDHSSKVQSQVSEHSVSTSEYQSVS
ncbi:accessory Sec-dependent serine-rich glycoprotein adhesin, partial [Ligilactobacillus equi]|uniref:accessory Sec-dependent serine-rich glycoprotein adhesin n=1 Tax=Ligilactobacillus equi TaxID=137357 RepID=UPI002ED1CC7B